MNDFHLGSILDKVAKISLRGGVVSKVCIVLIVVALVMGAIAWTVKIVWVSVLAAVLVFVLCFTMLWRLISFADRNPQAAILEGAEFILHEQLLRLGTKELPLLTVDPKDFVEFHPLNLSPEEQKKAQLPDSVPPEQQPGDGKAKEGSDD